MEKRGKSGPDKKRVLGTVAATLFCLCVSITVARADLTIVSRTKTFHTRSKMLPAYVKNLPQIYMRKTYYKGAKIRLEIKNGYVSLYDTKSGKLYYLNAADKTYTVTFPASEAAADPLRQGDDRKTTLTLKTGAKKQIIAGKRTINYLFEETTLLGRKPNAIRKGIDEGSLLPSGPKVWMSNSQGEAWITNQVKLTGIAATSLPSLMSSQGIVYPDDLSKPLADRLSRLHGCLLFSKTTQVGASIEQINAEAAQYPTITTYEVVSLKESPLPDKWFAIPANYKQVKNKPTLGGGGAGL